MGSHPSISELNSFTFPLGHSVPIPGVFACPQSESACLRSFAPALPEISLFYIFTSSVFYSITSLYSLLLQRCLPWSLTLRKTAWLLLPIFLTPLYCVGPCNHSTCSVFVSFVSVKKTKFKSVRVFALFDIVSQTHTLLPGTINTWWMKEWANIQGEELRLLKKD